MSDNCLLSFVNKFKDVPLISMTAFNDNFMLNLPTKSSLVPALNPYPFLNHNPVTFTERVSNVLMHLADKLLFFGYTSPQTARLIQRSVNFDTPSLYGLSSRSILFLTNYDPAVDGPQQLPSNAIGVGGLQIRDPKPLPDVSFAFSFY